MVAQNGSVAPVVAGSALTLRESLEAMLLPSGNNYSDLARELGVRIGATPTLERRTAWLAEHGLADTTHRRLERALARRT